MCTFRLNVRSTEIQCKWFIRLYMDVLRQRESSVTNYLFWTRPVKINAEQATECPGQQIKLDNRRWLFYAKEIDKALGVYRALRKDTRWFLSRIKSFTTHLIWDITLSEFDAYLTNVPSQPGNSSFSLCTAVTYLLMRIHRALFYSWTTLVVCFV